VAAIDNRAAALDFGAMLKFQPARRTRAIRCVPFALALLGAGCRLRSAPATPDHVYELRDARWLGADGFHPGTRYVVDGRFTQKRPARVDSVIDLAGRWIVPPFGEAHNHNVDYTTPRRTDSLLARYLHDGVFYVQNPGNLPRGRDSLAGRVNVPGAIDVTFANGLLTATGGHPMGLYQRNLARGGMSLADGDGAFFWLIDSLPDLERKWPRILAQRPDFIKVVLVHSEEFARRRNDSAYFNWRGIDPALVPAVVQRAHAAGLRVGAHVDTRGDFHNALVGGVDEILHVPGFRGDERTELTDPAPYEISEADAKLAASRGVVVVTTLGGALGFDPHGADSTRRRQFDALATRNLRALRAAGVRLALGSDTYRDDSALEAEYLATLGVFTPLELVRLWSEATPRAIYPTRNVGCLAAGCEASFLALAGDPSNDFSSTKRIVLRMKGGRLLP
jgi:imidazolonepropionase-like amidohydrolase